MVRYKYTPEALAAAAAVARSVTEVMRLLGVRVSGGSHAHISRQLKRFGIDTSHFTGARNGAGRRERRTTSAQLLARLPEGSRRIPGTRLRWALGTIGVPEECEECGIGPSWRGKPLILHVDHINGDSLDNRPPNLRILCPNCHSQTATYAGRSRRVFGTAPPDPPAPSGHGPPLANARRPVTERDLVELFGRVDARELTATEAAHRVGCHPNHLHRIRQRLEQEGVLRPRPAGRRWRSAALRETVIEYALANPDLGPKRLARLLQQLPNGGCEVSRGTIFHILSQAGLTTRAARRSRLTNASGSGETRQTRRI
ncbi:HNH endonuclease [Micromonospora sp. C28SCA-DRY-2]|uniref:HNH endonuclease n=1 Tax=Micromonospora sp. C28SCA-DRY-2 TaxID=3059522 RepID=UPI00267588D6|nr:HNH endonuclease [Micromonospora sp. C28SCA-DRY-2]MDO3700847.1 HNH endonuclease [Micromonospora sp. C28SCA-DRY-2]